LRIECQQGLAKAEFILKTPSAAEIIKITKFLRTRPKSLT